MSEALARPASIDVLVVSPLALHREALSLLLGRVAAVRIVGTWNSAAAWMNAAADLGEPVVVWEITGASAAIFRDIGAARATCPNARLLLLGDSQAVPFIRLAFNMGASGYLLRDCSAAGLVAAVKSVGRAARVSDRRVHEMFLASIDPADGWAQLEDHQLLSGVELQILSLVALGLTNEEIASHVSLKLRDVERRLSGAVRKLGAHSRTDAVVRCYREGWLNLDQS